MSDYEIITDGGRRRRWSSSEKLRIVEETLDETAVPEICRLADGLQDALRNAGVIGAEPHWAA